MDFDDCSLRCFPELKRDKFKDEKVNTDTSREQINTESLIEKCFDRFEHMQYLDVEQEWPRIHRKEHGRFIETALRTLTRNYECLDSSRPWLVYWILNSAHLLNHTLAADLLDDVVTFLVHCRCPNGGFGGGPGQYAHLAPTYAAVNSLCIIGTERAFEAIDRKTLLQFLWAVRESSGAFRMHVDGETDIRGVYCAVTVAKLSQFSAADERKLFEGTIDWICRCQTYEGGIGGAPDLEAHGGYTFCGIAALALLGSTGRCDLRALLRWAINRQMRYEGGFQGRTNKLVDGCYSFWQGAILPIVQALINKSEPEYRMERPLFNRGALQEYILICCQRPTGGLIDKPGKPPDLYHTCYTLSGLSVAQHCEAGMNPLVIGDPNNELLPTHPMFNVPPKAVWKSYVYFTENIWDMYGEGGGGGAADEEEVAEKNKEKKMGDDESISDCGANDERSSSARRGESMSSTNDDDRSGVVSSGFGGGGKDKDTDSMITDDDGISVSTSATSN